MKPVVLISANAEWRAVKELYPDLQIQTSPLGEFARLDLPAPVTLFHGGWGKVSAAATAQYALDRFAPSVLINLGTCGGFAGRVERGAILLAERTLIYDIIEQMGDAQEAIERYAARIDLSWLEKIPPGAQRALLLSADRDIVAAEIPTLVKKYNAIAADWESGAIAWVAQRNGTRVLILRGVTDLVGAAGGEAYGEIEIYHRNTRAIMKTLFDLLPQFLKQA